MSNYEKKIYRVKQLKNEFYKNGNVKQPRERRKQSNFFITINTNQRLSRKSERDRQLAQRFQKVCEVFLDNIEKFIKTHEGYPTDDKRTIEIVPHIEVSDDRNLLHIHFTCEIIHSSKIHMDLSKIRTFFRHNTGTGKNCNVFIKWYPGSKITNEQRIKNYVLKGSGGYNGPEDLEEVQFSDLS